MGVIYDVSAYAGKWPGKERRDLRMEPVCGACVWSPRVENESMIVMLGL